jgi:hypothetical protein
MRSRKEKLWTMKHARFSEEQIIGTLREREAGPKCLAAIPDTPISGKRQESGARTQHIDRAAR